ncbi:hypothetical protein BaRGS_00036220 [Batillaria attramentaria]|uniref:Uncharacterized protein n=1 Tax=Batillaria attramentaria TaxID=370345 RepID=A0ABD0JCK3_9CAEN
MGPKDKPKEMAQKDIPRPNLDLARPFCGEPCSIQSARETGREVASTLSVCWPFPAIDRRPKTKLNIDGLRRQQRNAQLPECVWELSQSLAVDAKNLSLEYQSLDSLEPNTDNVRVIRSVRSKTTPQPLSHAARPGHISGHVSVYNLAFPAALIKVHLSRFIWSPIPPSPASPLSSLPLPLLSSHAWFQISQLAFIPSTNLDQTLPGNSRSLNLWQRNRYKAHEIADNGRHKRSFKCRLRPIKKCAMNSRAHLSRAATVKYRRSHRDAL